MLSSSKRILVNALPKSGTHLLSKAIDIFGYKNYLLNENKQSPVSFFNYRQVKDALSLEAFENINGNKNTVSIGSLSLVDVPENILQKWLNAVPQNYYIQGHIPQASALNSLINTLNYHHLVIIRDPRAVIASLVPFILQANNYGFNSHFLEEDFKLMSKEQRFNFILQGGYAEKAQVYITPFAQVYQSFYAWNNQSPNCLLLRFEDLIGENGGGDNQKQMQAMVQISNYLDLTLSKKMSQQIKTLFDSNARTFRIGKIDSWKDSLDSQTIKKLNEYCEPLCLKSGYEV